MVFRSYYCIWYVVLVLCVLKYIIWDFNLKIKIKWICIFFYNEVEILLVKNGIEEVDVLINKFILNLFLNYKEMVFKD